VARRSRFGPLLGALMRTTFTNTIVERGFRSNVVPRGAEATVNMRLLPGVSGEQAVRELRRAIDDQRVKIVVGATTGRPPRCSGASASVSVWRRPRQRPTSTPHWRVRSRRRTGRGGHPGPVRSGDRCPTMARARHPGLRPYRASATDFENMHGIDERVSITGLNEGDMVERILRAVATD
jgi:acetylornithine deacetylase/succinyl-diaminopimelate desuccinylase-like protein